MDKDEAAARAKKGDDNAFYELIQERREMLYRTAFTYVGNREDALDIVGDTVYKAYVSIRKLKEPKFFNTWLTRILINCAMDHMRKGKKAIPLDEGMDIKDNAPAGKSEEIMDLYDAVDRLEGRCKAVVILKYFEDLTLNQVAEILECPIGTVKTYLHRALKELRLELKEEW
jgi:RNA polymerase sigma-70 factor (ECF subfamily)